MRDDVERFLGGDPSTGWTPITEEIELTPQPLTVMQVALGITRTTWNGNVGFVTNVGGGGQYRVVIREYEWFQSYNATIKPRDREAPVLRRA